MARAKFLLMPSSILYNIHVLLVCDIAFNLSGVRTQLLLVHADRLLNYNDDDIDMFKKAQEQAAEVGVCACELCACFYLLCRV